MTDTDLMPTLFIGHGSPMNVIEDNKFTQGWEKIARVIPKPSAILCISAHWYISSTQVGGWESPRTIHDFYGFPRELYNQQYPAPGAPEIAHEVKSLIDTVDVYLDFEWGLDHGTWSVLTRMYPEANIPTTQLSIDYSKSMKEHYEIGRQLQSLRSRGVLIMGSGNLVHNLRLARLDMLESWYDWVPEFDDTMVSFLREGNHEGILNYTHLGEIAKLAHPTPDHFIPLLYSLGATSSLEEVVVFNKEYMAGSLSMTSLLIG